MNETQRLGIGDSMRYSDSKGREAVGLILNTIPAVLADIATGEQFTATKFYLWDEIRERGFWTCEMRATLPATGAKS